MLLQRLEEVCAAAKVDASFLHALGTAVTPKACQTTGARPPSTALSRVVGLCCAAAGGDPQQDEIVVEAWTLLYAALHILDAVEDGDIEDAAWAQWGQGPAINIATALIAATGSTLGMLEQTGVPRDAAHEIRHTFFQTLLHMTAGQHADLTLREPTLEQCWQIAGAKSGAWFALAGWVGARLATADATRLEHFRQFGHHLGMLVQVGNDVGGIWPKGDKASDLVYWPRWTLPVAYAMTVLDSVECTCLQRYLRAAPTDPDAEAEARRMIIKAGAVMYLATEAYRYQQDAQETLISAAVPSAARDALLEVLQACSLSLPI
jgi:geranylgeranyl diphosphate synthase type I